MGRAHACGSRSARCWYTAMIFKEAEGSVCKSGRVEPVYNPQAQSLSLLLPDERCVPRFYNQNNSSGRDGGFRHAHLWRAFTIQNNHPPHLLLVARPGLIFKSDWTKEKVSKRVRIYITMYTWTSIRHVPPIFPPKGPKGYWIRILMPGEEQYSESCEYCQIQGCRHQWELKDYCGLLLEWELWG